MSGRHDGLTGRAAASRARALLGPISAAWAGYSAPLRASLIAVDIAEAWSTARRDVRAHTVDGAALVVRAEQAENGPLWLALRHGGRAGDAWRVTLRSSGEGYARPVFEREHAALRQGAIALADPSGVIVRWGWAPRLRSRW